MGVGGRIKSNSIPRLLKVPGRHCDGAGLYLVVTKPGTANWSYRYMSDGKQREIGLGGFQTTNVTQARSKAAQAASLNPANIAVLREVLPKQNHKPDHHGAMPWQEIPAFYRRLLRVKGTGACALRFTMLLAARTTETREATWQEIDFEKALWTIPAERMKTSVTHIVPLPLAAIRLLKSMMRGVRVAPSDYIFPGDDGTSPLSLNTMLKLVKVYGGASYTTHGFRSTIYNWTTENTKTESSVIKRVIAHANNDKTTPPITVLN